MQAISKLYVIKLQIYNVKRTLLYSFYFYDSVVTSGENNLNICSGISDWRMNLAPRDSFEK